MPSSRPCANLGLWEPRGVQNRLADETSPYLRQHADNPVHWQPWGPEAFAAAAERDVPVLLSVGYSSCHWCHVMAHESFEDPEVAAVMNQWFVPVKVDREERPDVDAIYMEATQAMTGSGGWPMTVFMDSDGRPFYCGTYCPKSPRGGMPGFVELMEAVNDAWTQRRHELGEQADRLTETVARELPVPSRSAAGSTGALESIFNAAVAKLHTAHDSQWGGFGNAPKFPQTHSIGALLRHHHETADPRSRQVALKSLDSMAAGGMADHIGGGFSRYSVDRQWLVPHFEKMLYDNALLTRVYLDAHLLTGEERFGGVCADTITYVLRDLSHPDGGRYSAEDADSLPPDETGSDPGAGHPEEGAFYTFTPDQVAQALDDAGLDHLLPATIEYFGITGEANFEGAWIPNRIAQSDGYRCPPELLVAREALLEYRSRRPRPGLDDKVLTEWNALWVSAAAAAGAGMDRPEWVHEAERTAEFLIGNLRGPDGRWMRSWQDRSEADGPTDGQAKHLAYAADYATLTEAFLELYFATGKLRWLEEATTTAHGLLDLFWDPDGGLFTTGTDAEQLLVRPREFIDNATPAATSTAAVAMLQLDALLGDQRLAEAATAIVQRFAPLCEQSPLGFGRLLAAVHFAAVGATEVVTTGGAEMATVVQRRFTPTTVLAWNEIGEGPLWEGRNEAGVAWVCRNMACEAPVRSADDLLTAVSRGS